jgi:hypothetical protein
MREIMTRDIKLAALILTKVPQAKFYVKTPSLNDVGDRQSIVISFQDSLHAIAEQEMSDYINCDATVNLFQYNRKLNLVRDKIKGRRYD